jgi:hypothetical protein
MKLGNIRRKVTGAEHGYVLIVIMIVVALLAIASLERVQSLTVELKRDQEEEMIHRGAQYARAVKKFYKKFNTYPTSIEQLEKTNNMRFLRKRYKDPITGGNFRLVRMSELPAILGSGSPTTAMGTPAGQNTSGNLNAPPTQGLLNNGSLGANSTNPQNNGSPGTNDNSSANSGNNNSGDNNNENTSSSGGKGKPDSNFGASGQPGGGPIIGVASTSSKVSLKEFNKKNHYKDWFFIYTPQMDTFGAAGGVLPVVGGPVVGVGAVAGVGVAGVAAGSGIPPLIKGPYVPPQNSGGNPFGGTVTTGTSTGGSPTGGNTGGLPGSMGNYGPGTSSQPR